MEKDHKNPVVYDMEEMIQRKIVTRQKKCPEVYIDNKPTTLKDALHQCVQEQTVYMPDYILDENGVLNQLRFDRIDLL